MIEVGFVEKRVLDGINVATAPSGGSLPMPTADISKAAKDVNRRFCHAACGSIQVILSEAEMIQMQKTDLMTLLDAKHVVVENANKVVTITYSNNHLFVNLL